MENLVKRQIARTAQQILVEEIGLVDGCRRLIKLFNSLDPEEWDGELFNPIIAVESETEYVPVGELRSMWNPQALAIKEAQAKTYLDQVKDWIYQACRGLIDKYEGLPGE